MEKFFFSMEDILVDEAFLSWYFKESDEKIQSWEQWLALHPEQQLLVAEAVKLISQLHLQEKGLPVTHIELAMEQLNAAINKKQQNTAPVVSIKRSKNRRWLSAAAAVFIIFTTITIWNFSSGHKKTYATAYGQLSKHILPDSSEVTLNANSTIKLGSNWKQGDREVWLNGEAFFHVKKTSTHERFIVHADQMDVIVTGTQFNVITRYDKNSVFLAEGSVTLQTKDGREIKMLPGDFVELNDNRLRKKTANEEAILAWKNNQLLFEGTTMPEVAKIITEHYGIKVILANMEVRNGTLSGIMANDNLDVLLKSLEAAKNYKITRNDSEIIIAKP